ncbi:MAG: tellurite resistance protein [Thermoleophilaceae bacterium]|nr:tellurite resistance protein [Thermoleophilaceae bacterium]
MTLRSARIPPNFFGIALGLTGLAGVWLYASDRFGAPAAVGDGLSLLAACVFVLVAAAYVRQGPRQIVADARDPAVGPFLAAAPISGLLLGEALAAHAPTAGRAVVIVFLVVGLLLGGWLTGQWMTGGLVEESFGPAFFLPGLGMGFVASEAATTVGMRSIAEMYFGIGTVAWVLMSSVVFNRVFFRPRLAPALLPTMAIELAPAALAGSAHFALHPAVDSLALGLAGYAAFMVVAQLRLLPLYRALTFTPGFWSFTFPCAAVALVALRWLSLESPAGNSVYAWILIAAVTGLIAAIAARTLVALTRGKLLPLSVARGESRFEQREPGVEAA